MDRAIPARSLWVFTDRTVWISGSMYSYACDGGNDALWQFNPNDKSFISRVLLLRVASVITPMEIYLVGLGFKLK